MSRVKIQLNKDNLKFDSS